MTIQKVLNKHQNFLQGTPRIFFSPGRVNLIGEHIDYLGGNVFPTAIDLGTYALVTFRDDQEFHFLSDNFPKVAPKIVHYDQLGYDSARRWANYPTGMLEAFVQRGLQCQRGLNVLIYGTLPNGAGLSSSASLEVLMGVVLETMYQFPIDRVEMIQIAQDVENNYVGVNCGIMDQFAVGMGKKHHAMYLDTTSLAYEYVPLTLTDDIIVIANTNKKRALADSKYNERRKECDQGLELVQQQYPDIHALCDVTPEMFASIEQKHEHPLILKRIRHAMTEQARTIRAVDALQHNDITLFGRLLNQSHASLRDDYNVSCHELDVMAQAFVDAGAMGARMTGAGFGGCVVAIVPKTKTDVILTDVRKRYIENTNYHPTFYRCDTSDGAKEITKEVLR